MTHNQATPTTGETMTSEEAKSQHKVAEDEKAAWDMQDMQTGKPHGWIQWKGTNVCMDIHCKCGALGHIDEYFAYHVKCGNCGTVYFCNGHIEFIELRQEPKTCVLESEVDEDVPVTKPMEKK